MKRTRLFVRRSLPGWWGLGFSRSLWPLPKPKGMALYVLHLVWWNVVLEYDR